MRARINERLEQATRFPVALIVAPAGFGKSVALRDFLESRKIDAVRYDVRREDGTLLAFVRRFSEALEGVAPSALAAFPAMQERVFAAEEPVRRLSDWLAEHLKDVQCTIAIDDLHFAAVDAASIALLADVIERTGDRIKWIIAARSDVGLPVATWVAYGRMDIPLGEDELRFTTDEALAVAEHSARELEAHEVESLRQLTEGWPVAVTIALRTRTHSTDLRTASFGTREMVYRYLAEQVFSALSAEQRAFALATSVFSSFTTEIANALGATAAFLADLRLKLAFLSESSPGEYRYHELFRDFLETELRRTGEAEWARAVCRAANLLAQREQYADALMLYAKAHSSPDILEIVERHGFSLFERGQSEPLAAALAVLAEAARRSNATALGLRAMLDASRGHFELAEPQFLSAIDAAGDTALRIQLVHRYAIELVRNGRDCVGLLQPYAVDATLAADVRVQILGTLATGYVGRRDLERAKETIESALALAESDLPEETRARLFQQAAHVYAECDLNERARHYADMAIERALEHNLYEVAARAYSVLYSFEYAHDDLTAALQMLDKLGECARKGGTPRISLYGIVASYDIEAELGDEAALARLDETLRETQSSLPANRVESLLPALAMREAWVGNFGRAYDLLASTASQQTGDERRALRAAETALYAVAAGMQHEGEAALGDAEQFLAACAEDSRRAIRARVVLAVAEIVRGRLTHAHRLLAFAEQRARPQMRRLRALCDAARTAYRVQLEQAEHDALDAAAQRLAAEQLGGFAKVLLRLPLAAGQSHAFGTLTPAEREILLLLAKGASTKDVANATGRSPHTVDTHIRSLCRKLGCSGRREAVALATSQGWVQT